MQKYNVHLFHSNNLHPNRSTLGQIRNQLITAIEVHKIFPKAIAIIPDADLLEIVSEPDFGISDVCGRITHWLAAEFNKICEIHKERLPAKAIRKTYPKFIWITPQQHKNFSNSTARGKMAKAMKSALIPQSDHIVLNLKKNWDHSDSSLVQNNRITHNGYKKYWMSFDSAMEFWDRHLSSKAVVTQAQYKPHSQGYEHSSRHTPDLMKKFFDNNRNDRFHWNSHYEQRRPLPMPPHTSGYRC